MEDLKKLCSEAAYNRFGENALRILKKRYLLKDEKGEPKETLEGLFTRVSNAVSKGDPDLAIEFYEMMNRQEFMPNSPTLMNAGLEDGQLCACFVTDVEDSMQSIMGTLTDWSLIFKSGGGVGTNFSKLRPENDPVHSTSGASSGPVSFMQVYDKMIDVVKQGGRRRGASMGCLDADHPDIFKFIRAKNVDKTLSNFNISVMLTDGFMHAVENDLPWRLVNPRTKEITKTIKARELFDLIVQQAWLNGEPGILFKDAINRGNPTPWMGEIRSTNP